MKFTDGGKHLSVSEIFDDMTVIIEAENSNHTSIRFDFKEMELRELRKHLTIQIRKIKKDGKKES